jgi:hypothetical protein
MTNAGLIFILDFPMKKGEHHIPRDRLRMNVLIDLKIILKTAFDEFSNSTLNEQPGS